MSTTQIAVGYVRVSTDKQAIGGISLEAQADKIRAMAVVHGATLLEIIVDAGESAKSLMRPGMDRLLKMVDRREVQTVIVAKLDRMTRSVRDLGDLLERFNKRSVSLVSVAESLDTGSAAGRLVLNIMGAVSQWEREAIAERTVTALQHKRRTRQVYNHPSFGLKRVGESLVEVPEEQATIARIRDLRGGGSSLREIAGVLNAEGVRTKLGRLWHPQSIADVLRLNCDDSRAVG